MMTVSCCHRITLKANPMNPLLRTVSGCGYCTVRLFRVVIVIFAQAL